MVANWWDDGNLHGRCAGGDKLRRGEGHIEARGIDAGVVERPEHAHVGDDADDGAPFAELLAAVDRDAEAAAERARGAEMLPGEAGVHDGNGELAVVVVVLEVAALDETLGRNAE